MLCSYIQQTISADAVFQMPFSVRLAINHDNRIEVLFHKINFQLYWHSIVLTGSHSQWFLSQSQIMKLVCHFLQGKGQPLKRQSRPQQKTNFATSFLIFKQNKV